MTLSDFNTLSTYAQEEYINSGGIISEDSKGDKDKLPANDSSIADKKTLSSELISREFFTSPEIQQEVVSSQCPPSLIDETKDASKSSPLVDDFSVNGFDIRDPLELLFVLDDDVASGKITLHDWQIQFLLDFAEGGKSDKHPFQALLRACNGSGKDKYIIAPCVVWLCMRYMFARGVVTSSSGVQLDNQTCAYIDQLCLSCNRKWGVVWKTNYRYYECIPTQSPIICYATDEAGKAEGFHPLKFGAKMGIFVSEDKSVPDEINIALNKCSGYTHRVHASTPGNVIGHFHDMCGMAVERTALKSVNECNPEDYIHYKVTYKECSHISEADLKRSKRDLPGGEHGSAFKSQFLAEFSTTDEMVVIPYTYIWRAKKFGNKKWVPEEHNKAGLDLSDGGAETVLVVRNGNKVLKIIPFRFDNTEDTIEFLNEKFKENNLTHKECYIFSDCVGIGKPMLDRMRRQGWSNIRYIDSRNKSTRPSTYRNYGTELWFSFGSFLKQSEIVLSDDPILTKQLSTRYYKLIDGKIHALLSKPEMRSRGYPSPDRGDACVMAFADYKSTFVSKFDDVKEKPIEEEEKKEQKLMSDFTLKGKASGKSLGSYIMKNANGAQKDFSYLQDEVNSYNKSLILKVK